MAINEGTLQPGQRWRDSRGRVWKVVYVNASRAHCVAAWRVEVKLTGSDGRQREFVDSDGSTVDIAPTSGVELV